MHNLKADIYEVEKDNMIYFTSKLWSKYSGASHVERPKVELEWDKAVKEYNESFEMIKDRFSKKFIDIYYANSEFHDFHIKEFQMIHKDYRCKSPISINLIITDEINTWKITYKHVKNISIKVKAGLKFIIISLNLFSGETKVIMSFII
jgi:hypothetical protein